jgi:hypothetical protein
MLQFEAGDDVFPVGTLSEAYGSLVEILLNSHSEEVFVLPHVFYFPYFPNFIHPFSHLPLTVRSTKGIIRVRIG